MVSIFSDSIETHGSPSLVRVSLGIRFMIRIGRLNMVSAGGRVLPDTSAEADFLDEATNNCQSVPYVFCWNGTPGFYQIRKGFKKLTQRPGPKHSIDASA